MLEVWVPAGEHYAAAPFMGFPSISIKMAKEQNLSLNPAGSGLCGRPDVLSKKSRITMSVSG